MHPIRAKWTNGQIVPAEPVDWPEGIELLVEPLAPSSCQIDSDEDDWRDDPESVAKWIAEVESIEPMIWAEGEREEFERYREQSRLFNIEAVRKQMEEMTNGDEP